MTPHAKYHIVGIYDISLTIQDDGRGPTVPAIADDAEYVVAELRHYLMGVPAAIGVPAIPPRRLFYYDRNGHLDEILHRDGHCTGFAPGPQPQPR